ncbi:MAG: porin family protein [Flavobacteriaceae bacterium]|jgi:opacity protein-like surface antigen|nr:porin family protein [Flavobacteriaceae bacterium]
MKKITLLAALLVGGLVTTNAQVNVETPKLSAKVGTTPIKKGNWMVGSNISKIGYSFENKSFEFMLKPTAGYFISDGIAVGLEVGGGIKTQKKPLKDQWTYTVSPFVRYYFPEGASSTGRFFGQGNIGVEGAEGGESKNSFAFGINAGYSHFLSRNVALEAMAGYNYSKANTDGAEKQSGLGVAIGFQIFLGK